MKVYVLLDSYYGEISGNGVEVVGVYKTKEEAISKRHELVLANTEDEQLDWVLDETTQDLTADLVRLFYGYQENWNNYYETEIIECEVE